MLLQGIKNLFCRPSLPQAIQANLKQTEADLYLQRLTLQTHQSEVRRLEDRLTLLRQELERYEAPVLHVTGQASSVANVQQSTWDEPTI